MPDTSWDALRPALDASARGGPDQGVAYIDSHTAGEPTRVLLAPVEGHDPTWPGRIVGEPRGSGILVGVALERPSGDATARVHFFNNVGPLQMCVHATIGLAETLARVWPQGSGETLVLETEAGRIRVQRGDDGVVTVHNVESWWTRAAEIEVDGVGLVEGDVAWAGNWFFLARDPLGRIERDEIPRLERLSAQIRRGLAKAGIDGENGAEIDHVHLRSDAADGPSRVFVMCPGGQYDRSPCGTGTSALTAVLAHRGELGPGQCLRVQSAFGGQFEADFTDCERGIRPRVRGRAHITGQGWLLFDEDDPFRYGL